MVNGLRPTPFALDLEPCLPSSSHVEISCDAALSSAGMGTVAMEGSEVVPLDDAGSSVFVAVVTSWLAGSDGAAVEQRDNKHKATFHESAT